MRARFHVFHPILILIAGSCGGSDEESDGGSDDGGVDDGGVQLDGSVEDLAGPCPLETRIGEFDVGHRELYSAVTGSVREAVIPNAVLELVYEEGDCRLLRRLNPTCDPSCKPGETCNSNMECIPFPTNRDVGTVTTAGLTTDVSIEPNKINFNYENTDVDHPPFEPGHAIQLTAAGAELEGFTLRGFGVEPIVADNQDWVMMAGQPLEITWTGADGPWQIHVTLNIDQHGLSPVTMFCDLDDTGSGTIAASLVDQLIDEGFSGFASANLFRRTVDSVEIDPGCVQLATYSHLTPSLSLQK